MYKEGRDRLHAPSPMLKQMVTAGLSRPQERPGLLHLRGTRARPVVVSDALTPAADGDVDGADRTHRREGRRRRLGHDGHGHHRGVRQGRLRRAVRDPRSTEQVARGPQRARAVAGPRAFSAASSPRRRRTPPSPASPAPAARRSRRRRPRGRGRRRGDRRSRRPCSQTSTRSASRARCWPRPPRACPVVEMAAVTRRPDGRGGPALLQPGRDHEPGGGRRTRVDRRRRRDRRGRGLLDALGKHAGAPAATAPASSSTRCCSPTSTTPSGCSRPTTPRPTTSTLAMKKGCGYPMGPFELLDVVGNDVSLAIQQHAVPGVPRAGLRSGPDARAPRDGGLPRPQDRPRVPLLREVGAR